MSWCPSGAQIVPTPKASLYYQATLSDENAKIADWLIRLTAPSFGRAACTSHAAELE
jgi:hypothetical protein